MKWLAYRTPILREIGAPSYTYKVNPGELAALVTAIDSTADHNRPGTIVEIGVARGMTSFFLAQHLATIGDERTLVLIDTFGGFDPSSLEYEIGHRNKAENELNAFTYHSQQVFESQIRNIGYDHVKVIRADAATFDYSAIAPIDVVLLDIDLYLATKAAAAAIWPHLSAGGIIVIDDCIDGGPWDGSFQAYVELCDEFGCERTIVGGKGGILTKPLLDEPD